MLAELTILSTWGSSYYGPVESMLGIDSSDTYLINTENIVKYRVHETTDTLLEYKLNKKDDRSPEFTMLVDESTAALLTLSNATPDSAFITLNVYEGAYTFIDIAGMSTTAFLFSVDDIVWGNENEAGTATRILVEEGGFATRAFIVDHSIEQIVDLADTGTTTTTTSSTSSSSSTSTSSTSTSSTSSTSTFTTSTSTTSTSSTSTSSTSTSSTSSTSTSSTSTSSTSTSSTSTSSTSTSSTSTSSTSTSSTSTSSSSTTTTIA